MKKKLGFAFGAGGSRGVAHIGFLQAMEENGIRADCATGSSIGAVIGGCYAAGMSAEEMRAAAFGLKKSDICDVAVGLRLRSFFKSEKMREKIRELVGGGALGDLALPFACAAVDLYTGKEEILAGDLPAADAIAASASIPVIFRPVALNGKLYVDGGLRDRVPVGAARDLGADAVIGIDVLGGLREAKKAYSLTGVFFRMLEIYDCAASEDNMRRHKPDLLVEPDLGDASQYSFSDFEKSYEAGYAAGRAAVKSIERILGEKNEK